MKRRTAASSRVNKTHSRVSRRSHTRPTGESSPRPLTEDEADIFYAKKHKNEKGIPLDKVLEGLGIDADEVGL
jgi:hypothetical protein